MPRSQNGTKLCILQSVPGYNFSCFQGALSHLGCQGVCFPLMWFISNILEVGLNEQTGWNITYANSKYCRWHTIFHIPLGVTGGSQFALFITVNVVITFIAIFDGIIILIALATDWFDVSGFYLSFWDSVENFLDFPKCKELYISAFFLSEWKSI